MSFAETFKALSDPARREILLLLRGGRMSAGEIAGHFEMTGATVSYHLSVLKKADARGYMTELDARYLAHELSSDADGVIAKSERWREQVYKMGE